MLKQWFKLSCRKNRSKTLKIAVFSTHVEVMVQAFLPNKLFQNTVNHGVFYPILSQWLKLYGQTICPPNTANYSVFYLYCSNGSSLLAKQLAPTTDASAVVQANLLQKLVKYNIFHALGTVVVQAVFFAYVGLGPLPLPSR